MNVRAQSFAAHMVVWLVAGACLLSSGFADAFTLGTPKVISQPGQPIRAEIPFNIKAEEESQLGSLQVLVPVKKEYERLGVSPQILELNPKVSLDQREGKRLFVLIETALPVSEARVNEDPFMDVMLTLRWPLGQVTKNYTLLLGDPRTIQVRPGQTLSEIAAQIAPLYIGATLDQTILALYKANPDAFSGGSIHRLPAGVELSKPSQSLMQSITPAQAYQFVDQANQSWAEGRTADSKSSSMPKSFSADAPRDRLTIGPGADDRSDMRRYTEEIVAQEKLLEQTRARIIELEKNIADLQKLLDVSKAKSAAGSTSRGGVEGKSWAPGLLALGLMVFTGLVLWLMARQARRTEQNMSQMRATLAPPQSHSSEDLAAPRQGVPDRAKQLFAGIDLELGPVKTDIKARNEALRVKLNLAKAYITIEDFAAAKNSLEEILKMNSDPSMNADSAVIGDARALLDQINERRT